MARLVGTTVQRASCHSIAAKRTFVASFVTSFASQRLERIRQYRKNQRTEELPCNDDCCGCAFQTYF